MQVIDGILQVEHIGRVHFVVTRERLHRAPLTHGLFGHPVPVLASDLFSAHLYRIAFGLPLLGITVAAQGADDRPQ